MDSHQSSQGCLSSVVDEVISIPAEDEIQLLAKLQMANRMLEADSRSLRSLSPHPQSKAITSNSSETDISKRGLSRQSSMSSVISSTSGCSNGSSITYDDGNQDNIWAMWGNIVSDWENLFKRKSSYIKDFVRRGIPNPFRGIVWQLLCSASECPEKERYAEYLKMTSPFEKTISRDITRTFPGHDLFKEKDGLGQESLFNVMKAYSLYDREVGYCQGSSFIVGLLLMHMPEEEAFAVLVRIMNSFNLRELFKPSMAELGLCMFQLEAMIQDQLPELHSHFQMHGVATSMFASSWFLALFTTILPIPLACRVFDVFLSEGVEVIFRVGIAILQLNMEDILALDMEETVKFLQKDLALKVESDPDLLLNIAFQVRYNARKLKKLEKEYNALKAKEQEEQVELRRLRSENKLLQQRINNLEQETETLADRLIHDQVKCAQQEEEICILRRQVIAADKELKKESDRLSSPASSPSLSTESPSLVKAPRPSVLWQTLSNSKDKDTRIEQLQKELDETNAALVRLHHKVNQLENESLQPPQQNDSNLDSRLLQEDLIACKLREAEANMAIKELQHQVFEMEKHWQKFRERNRQSCDEKSSSSGGLKIQQLNESLMAGQIREAVLVSEMTDLKQRLVCLEQQDYKVRTVIFSENLNHTNELRLCRSQEETSSLRKILAEREKECSGIRSDLDCIRAKQKEDVMVVKLKEAELSQLVTELRRKIAELELQNSDLAARLESCRNSEDNRNEGFPNESALSNKLSASKVYLRPNGQPSFGGHGGGALRVKPMAAVTANALRAPEPDIDADRTPTNDSFNVDAFINENQQTVMPNRKFQTRRLQNGNRPTT